MADAPRRPRCSYCSNKLRPASPAGRPKACHRLTRDHIMPKAWRAEMPIGVRVTRPACEACNQLRALVGHCPAVLAIVRDLTRTMRVRSRRDLALIMFPPARAQETTTDAR